jgi:type VII secretion integral membrane protein EccD
MTSLAQQSETAAPAEPSRQSRRVLVGLMVGDIHVGVAVDAIAPVAMQVQAIVDLANARLGEIGQPRLAPTGGKDATGTPVRGRWALCWVDGTPMRTNRSLADQGVTDGTRLWLRFVDDTEARKPVIEHVTSAVPAELRKHFQDVTPAFAARVGTAMVAVSVAVVLAVLARWRSSHADWLAAAAASGLAVMLLIAATVIAIRSARHRRAASGPDAAHAGPDAARVDDLAAELFLRDVLLLAGAAATAVAVALAVPDPLGAPHAGLGAAVVLAAAGLIIRFTGGHIRLCTTAIVLALAALLTGLERMLLLTSAPTLLTITLLVTVLAIKMAPSVARQAARIRLPVFPSASGRWIWETRPDLPATVVVAAGKDPELDGPASVRDVALATDRVHSYLSGLLAGLCVLLVIAATGLCDPHSHKSWLALSIAGITAAWAVLHGRSYTDRAQATVLAVAGATIVAAVAIRYTVELWTAPVMVVCCAVTVVVPTVGLVAATVVPNSFYTPVFKQLVEWTEYVLLLAMWPLGFWLIDVFTAIRYR